MVIVKIITIIPTHKRNTDFNRAFDSASNQSRAADHILVVHEREDGYPRLLSEKNVHVSINKRTNSLSGAINHAIDEIILNRHDWGIEPDSTWLALLDDDDWWEQTYLEECSSLASRGCKQVVAGLIRYDKSEPEGINLSIPKELDVNSFLIRNPHIQGSNMFVRLDSFLGSGGFDESLLSCTDRDFCIRLFEDQNHKWERLDKHLVHHDARKSGRISDPGSERKIQGLQRFAMKHQFRMSEDQWLDFLEISKNRFGTDIEDFAPTNSELTEPVTDSLIEDKIESDILSYDLTIGVTFSDLFLVERFVDSINRIASNWPKKIRMVSCLHGLNANEVESIINSEISEDIDITIYDQESSFALASDGGLGPWFSDQKSRSGVSWGRCVLHRRILDEIGEDKRPVIWILDEDMLPEVSHAELANQFGAASLIQAISYMEERSIDVGIGSVIGDPPVHPLFTSRTQLLDLHYSELSADCIQTRIDWGLGDPRDIHHDVSADRFDHLEFPWGMFEIKSSKSHSLELIRSGKYSSRPVHSDWRSRSDDDLIVRGGNTIILDSSSLGDWSNMAPLISGIQTRRGDSLWALLSQRIESSTVGKEERKVSWIPFAVPQDRKISEAPNLNIDNIRGDILGSMILRGLSRAFPFGMMKENRTKWELGGWEKELASDSVSESRIRESRLISSLFRSASLEDYLGSECSRKEIALNLFNSRFPEDAEDIIEMIFVEMPTKMSIFRSAQPKIRPHWQIESAIAKLDQHAKFRDYEVIGHGSEGVVFRKGEIAIKVYHDGISLDQENADLISELGQASISCIPKNFTIVQNEPNIISYQWVEGNHPVSKTNARPWLDLLRECKEKKIAYWDLKPQNLILSPENKLTIIDIGKDLKPFEEDDWESMVRKAYLCWKHWEKPNLRELLTRSLSEHDPSSLPELEGLASFRNAIVIQDKSDLHDPWFVEIVRSNYFGKTLDWGCGSGKLTKQLADSGLEIDAFDPNQEMKQKVTSGGKVNWIDGPDQLAEGSYALAICNLVLCEIENDEEATDVLKIISRSIRDDGRALITVCNPESVTVNYTTTIQRPDVTITNGKISYDKIVRSTGRIRMEHTRSLELVRRFAKLAGLKISKIFHSPGINVDDCTDASEYLGLEMSKI